MKNTDNDYDPRQAAADEAWRISGRRRPLDGPPTPPRVLRGRRGPLDDVELRRADEREDDGLSGY
jgi:hypothetical protein